MSLEQSGMSRQSVAGRVRRLVGMGAVFCLGGMTLALAQANLQKLIINGKVASREVRTLDGKAYVPVSDVARALGQNVISVSGGYEITLPGGANQVSGLTGKVGDVLFDGSWRFQVNQVSEVQNYKERYTEKDPKEWQAADGGKLIVVDVTLKNGMNFANWLQMYSGDEKILTSLAGADGSSVKFTSFDMHTASGMHYGGGGDWDNTPKMLPGSEQKFTILFKAAKDFAVKDLVFTLAYPESNFGKLKYVNLRVSLQAPKADN